MAEDPLNLGNLWRDLDPDEVTEFRQAARDKYKPGEPINPTWHPVYRDECQLMNAEQARDLEVRKTTRFGWLLQRRLDQHANDKGRLNWEDLGVTNLFVLAAVELGELGDAIMGVDYDDPASVDLVIDECGDLANYAMMIADNLGALEEPK